MTLYPYLYFGIGIVFTICLVILSILYRKKINLGPLEDLLYKLTDDNASFGLSILCTLFFWPLIIIIGSFILILYLLYLICLIIGNIFVWIIEKFIR
jgi:hypothetical protein